MAEKPKRKRSTGISTQRVTLLMISVSLVSLMIGGFTFYRVADYDMELDMQASMTAASMYHTATQEARNCDSDLKPYPTSDGTADPFEMTATALIWSVTATARAQNCPATQEARNCDSDLKPYPTSDGTADPFEVTATALIWSVTATANAMGC